MFQLRTEAGIEEIHSFEVDEFDFIRSVNSKLDILIQFGERDRQLTFVELFSDHRTRDLFERLLSHVRDTSESISFPYRCDSETHCIYLHVIISKSSSQSVQFSNKVISAEKRPPGVCLQRTNCDSDWDYIACSICSRICSDVDSHESVWHEFQSLSDNGQWPEAARPMRCRSDVCGDCEHAVLQRMSEARRTFERKSVSLFS